jgi:hypothetical protein
MFLWVLSFKTISIVPFIPPYLFIYGLFNDAELYKKASNVKVSEEWRIE